MGKEGEDGGSVGRCEGSYLEFGLREVGGGLLKERRGVFAFFFGQGKV